VSVDRGEEEATAFTLAGCLVGYVIVALVFRKFLQVSLGWGRGSLVFVAGWVLATIPGRAVPNSEPIQPAGSVGGETPSDEDIENVPLPPWTCSRCGEGIEEGFDSCWKCGNTREKS